MNVYVQPKSEWGLTGETRHKMSGSLWWKRPKLQVQEARVAEVTEFWGGRCTDIDQVTQTRWRFANAADELNLRALKGESDNG